MENIFIKKFKETKSWKDFTEIYLKNPYSIHKSKGFLRTAVADEDIWPFFIIALQNHFNYPFFIVTATSDRANEIKKELKMLSAGIDILLYPAYGKNLLHKNSGAEPEKLSERFEVLKRVSEFKNSKITKNVRPLIVVSAANSIIDKIASNSVFENSGFEITTNKEYDRQQLVESLVSCGYERVSKVFDRGEFSIKGDVVDVFDIASKNPSRIDFSDDIVVKIFNYEIEDFSIINVVQKLSIYPNLDPADVPDSEAPILESITDFFNESLNKYCFLVCDPPEVSLKIKSDINILYKSFEYGPDYKNYLTFVQHQNIATVNASKSAGVPLPGRLPGSMSMPENQARAYFEKRFIRPDFFENDEINNIRTRIDLISAEFEAQESDVYIFSKTTRQKKSPGNSAVFLNNLKKDLKNKKTVAISMDNLFRISKIGKILTDSAISFRNHFDADRDKPNQAREGYEVNFQDDVVNILDTGLLSGFDSEKFSLYGELDIYDHIDSIEQISVTDEKAKAEFDPGDYIVHKTHGIGRYINIISEQSSGNKKEYFLIEYANNDRLFVPVWQSDRIHKYVGDKVPVVTALNSKQWNNLRKKVRSSIQKLALDLASLYAVRDAARGFAFTADDIWQKEMEDLFPFTETRDQLKAIEDVKEFMAADRPMDLLVCGDVGFGKTEVAVRSAFKAIENNKQVLMLVPTTILADQHARTFKERYENFPVSVEVVSRFKTVKQQRDIVKRFEEKKVDMLIGTHRILSEDIKPADLGLIIIDEEQRFGVNAKEKLKLLKKSVDVLTLTATPIPRTLHMSLAGIRDIALIETHPSGRFPIETFVGENNDIVIKMAIEREIKRGGQVYYVHNRISDIYEKQYRLQLIVPDAKIAVTHGRMEGKEIEDIMQKFIDKKYEILLTTSIIESGMDISNVNTLIVENAHRFGLAQLYQIRGRVGRSSEKAYAYFFYPDRKILNQTAFQRLKTLSEYTDLGSGYKIAMKDLEIRGAGELLGARQHGHINSLGFELYCQIIKEEVDKLKGLPVQEDFNIHIELPVSAYIPKNYINRQKDRIYLYKALGQLRDLSEAESIEEEMVRKHGKIPEVVKNLMIIAMIKMTAKKAGIEQITYSEKRGLVFKKINLDEQKAKDLLLKVQDFTYNHRSSEVILKKSFKDLNLQLVLNYLNDIIAFI